MTGCLILLRHGQSECNAAGLFTGWENAYLTAKGEEEAAYDGSLLAEHGLFSALRSAGAGRPGEGHTRPEL